MRSIGVITEATGAPARLPATNIENGVLYPVSSASVC